MAFVPSWQVPYRWDEVHELILERSKNSSLVIINMPDPPDMIGEVGASHVFSPTEMEEMLEYMNYMEGLASNLPRVLYVHGAGQEVIQFDKLE